SRMLGDTRMLGGHSHVQRPAESSPGDIHCRNPRDTRAFVVAAGHRGISHRLRCDKRLTSAGARIWLRWPRDTHYKPTIMALLPTRTLITKEDNGAGLGALASS